MNDCAGEGQQQFNRLTDWKHGTGFKHTRLYMSPPLVIFSRHVSIYILKIMNEADWFRLNALDFYS
jgi:hypothetical protein